MLEVIDSNTDMTDFDVNAMTFSFKIIILKLRIANISRGMPVNPSILMSTSN